MASYADMLLATNWQYAPSSSLSQSILSGPMHFGTGDEAMRGMKAIKAYNKQENKRYAGNYGGYTYDWSGTTSVVGNSTMLTRQPIDPGNNQHRPLRLPDSFQSSAQANQAYFGAQYSQTAVAQRSLGGPTWGIQSGHQPGGINWDGPYLTTRNDMMGGERRLAPSEYIHDYAQYPALANQYESGQINASQFFTGQVSQSVINDRDTLNNGAFTFSAPPRVRFSFSGGRGSISGTGIGFQV